MDITEQVSSIGTLSDDTRRALYEHVAAQSEPVSRESAANAVGIAPHMARFHLDKLVEAGLLETEFRRLTGRSGPGAGRPSKLYRRVSQTIAVSLPERRYDLVGHLLAGAIERAADGTALDEAVAQVAHDEGRAIAASAPPSDQQDDLKRVAGALAAQGFEPREEDGALTLANCPFDSLAREHTELVCSANLALIGGILEGMDCPNLHAHGEPHAGQCCVAIRPAR